MPGSASSSAAYFAFLWKFRLLERHIVNNFLNKKHGDASKIETKNHSSFDNGKKLIQNGRKTCFVSTNLMTNDLLCTGDKDGGKVTAVMATTGSMPDQAHEISYCDTKVIGNGSFGVVYQARLIESGDLVAIKKVLQDKRFKVRLSICLYYFNCDLGSTRVSFLETIGATAPIFLYWAFERNPTFATWNACQKSQNTRPLCYFTFLLWFNVRIFSRKET